MGAWEIAESLSVFFLFSEDTLNIQAGNLTTPFDSWVLYNLLVSKGTNTRIYTPTQWLLIQVLRWL